MQILLRKEEMRAPFKEVHSGFVDTDVGSTTFFA